MSKRKVLIITGAAAVSLLMAMPAFAATAAATSTSAATSQHTHKGAHKRHGVIGTITAINGTSLTVTTASSTVYTIDASSATVQKGLGKSATTLTLADLSTGTKIAVLGTVSGNSVTAKKIFDGVTPGERRKVTNAAFGTVASINGSTFTLSYKTKAGTVTNTVSTTPDTIYKENGKVGTQTELAVGQRVVVMGTKSTTGDISSATSVTILVHK